MRAPVPVSSRATNKTQRKLWVQEKREVSVLSLTVSPLWRWFLVMFSLGGP